MLNPWSLLGLDNSITNEVVSHKATEAAAGEIGAASTSITSAYNNFALSGLVSEVLAANKAVQNALKNYNDCYTNNINNPCCDFKAAIYLKNDADQQIQQADDLTHNL